MQRRTWAISIAAGAALLAVLAWAFAPRPLEVETAVAGVGPFELTVDEDGRTRLSDRYVVSAPLAGGLARIVLREGDAVAAGDLVATIAPAPSPLLDERSEGTARARADAARAQWQRAGVRVERAGVGVEQARLELQRSEQLAANGFVAPTKLDADRLSAQAAAAELETARQEREIARHELEQAQAALGALRRPGVALPAFGIRSPVAGRVLRVLQRSEGSVAPGAPLVELGDLERLEVVAEMLTAEALRTGPGTPVHLEGWGGPQALEGVVRRVEPAAFTKVSALGVEEQRVNVIIDIASPRERWQTLGDGFRVMVRAVVRSSMQALQVPSSAVFPAPAGGDGEARPSVFVVEAGRARLVPVLVEARHGRAAWISGGLAAGQTVVVYPPAALRDGARVRERRP